MESTSWMPLTDHCRFLNCHALSRRFYVWGDKKKNILISSTDAKRESKFVCLVRKANITVFLLPSASAKR